MSDSLYLIDASSYIHRAYHALPALATREGVSTNAVYGFAGMILKLLRERKPSHLAVVMDSAVPTFRKQVFPGYKASRPPTPGDLVSQFPLVEELARGFSLPVLRVDGFEADDIIAHLARRFTGEAGRVVIVSGDKDLMQLVSDRVEMLDTLRDRRIGPAEVEEKLGVLPSQVADYLSLRGDPGDDVPGVRGIGEKTAVALLAGYGDLDTLLARADEVKGKTGELLRKGRDEALLSRELVRLDREVPLSLSLGDLVPGRPDPEVLRPLFARLEFTRLLRELAQVTEGGPSAGSGRRRVAVDRSAYRLILEEKELADLAKTLAQAGTLAFDTETDSLDAVRAHLAGISLAWRDPSTGSGEGEVEGDGEAVKACYIPLAHSYPGAPRQIPAKRAKELLDAALIDPRIRKVAQNAKYDLIVLARAGWKVEGLWCDPMIASYLGNPGRRSHGLDALSAERLGHAMISYDQVTGKGRARIPFPQVAVEAAAAYSAEDADVALRVSGLLLRDLEDQGLTRLFHEVEMPLVPVLAEMERTGILLDPSALREFSRELEVRMADLEGRIHRAAGEEFNVGSPRQLASVLFAKLGLPPVRKTKTGWSTDSDVLLELAGKHEVPALVISFRELAKLRTTYADALPEMVNPETGRIHTSFNQTATATGRLSSSDPNLQNIPARTDLGRRIRAAFVAPPGSAFLSADYSQVELRILAHLSRDERLLESFRRGEDVHARTAREILGMGEKVVPEVRNRAKVVNFGIIYGMSAFGLARELAIPPGEAKKIIEGYFETYRGVKAWLDSTLEEARRTGYVTTLMGRRRAIPELVSGNPNLRQAGERMAINTPIQGTAADIIKVAMLRVHRALAGNLPDARLVLQVHDELLLEVPERSVPKAKELVSRAMEEAAELAVPLTVDMGTGKDWAEAH